MIKLDNVTLITVTSVNINEHIEALIKSTSSIQFAKVILVSHQKPFNLPNFIHWENSYEKFEDTNSYSKYMIYNLTNHITTDFCVTVQADGYIIRPDLWSNEFLNYDYIGSPWPLSYTAFIDPFGKHIRVGNGGFSLRSKRLLDVPKHINIPFEVNNTNFYKHTWNQYNEDANICVHNRHLYELMGCKFAPVELASKFSTEYDVPESVESFGFHKFSPYWISGKEKNLDHHIPRLWI